MLAATTAWWLVAVGLVSMVAAWFYTGGRKPYGYLGLGEVMVFVFFGLVAVVGTTYVQTRDVRVRRRLYAAVGIGALACAILVANNLRDIPTDTVAGKRTLAVVPRRPPHPRAVRRPGRSRARRRGRARRDHDVVGAARAGARRPGRPGRAHGPRGRPARDLVPVLQQTGIAELLMGPGCSWACSSAEPHETRWARTAGALTSVAPVDYQETVLDARDESDEARARLRAWLEGVQRGFHQDRSGERVWDVFLAMCEADDVVNRGYWLPEGEFGAGRLPVATFAHFDKDLNVGGGRTCRCG